MKKIIFFLFGLLTIIYVQANDNNALNSKQVSFDPQDKTYFDGTLSARLVKSGNKWVYEGYRNDPIFISGEIFYRTNRLDPDEASTIHSALKRRYLQQQALLTEESIYKKIPDEME